MATQGASQPSSLIEPAIGKASCMDGHRNDEVGGRQDIIGAFTEEPRVDGKSVPAPPALQREHQSAGDIIIDEAGSRARPGRRHCGAGPADKAVRLVRFKGQRALIAIGRSDEIEAGKFLSRKACIVGQRIAADD